MQHCLEVSTECMPSASPNQWRNWRGQMPPGSDSSDVGPFLEMGSLNSASFATKTIL